jgi:molybdopterin molybdotransferase
MNSAMLSVDEALRLVLDHAALLPPVEKPVEDGLDCVLAETIVSDIDSPPHDKAIVDGYALIAADISTLGAELKILEEVTAGAVPTRTVERGAATRIMTGAPLPLGADAVVMVEQTETAGDRIRILQASVKSGQNIMRRAASQARGQAILQPGKALRAIELGLLSEVGRSSVTVISPPRVAVLATGNELVGASISPGPGQIRNSNGPMLHGLAKQAGGRVSPLGIAIDDLNELTRDINAGLSRDVLILSGGVSAGVLDLVPKVLATLGVTQVFHKVNLKPGKPLLFGYKDRSAGHRTLVFGLPGNPVSSLVCFELFVRPAIQKMRGLAPTGLARRNARLTIDHQQRGDRPTYWPAAICEDEVKPLVWKGSGDLRSLTDANCLAIFAAGERLYRAGEEVEVLLLP